MNIKEKYAELKELNRQQRVALETEVHLRKEAYAVEKELQAALLEAIGTKPGDILVTEDGSQFKVSSFGMKSDGSKLLAYCYYQLKTGKWSSRPTKTVIMYNLEEQP